MHEPMKAGSPDDRRSRRHDVRLAADPDAVFPLLCPTREHDWIPTWRCEVVWSGTGYAELDGFFRTDVAGEGPALWVTVEHDPATRRVTFLRVVGGMDLVVRYALRVSADEGGSRLELEQVLTALTPAGRGLLQQDADDAWRAKWDRLGEMLVRHVATGD